MGKKETIEKKTEKLLEAFLAEKNFELVDVEYVREGSDWILRVLLDKEGGIRIDDCETVSRYLSEALDRADFIEEAYILEVSSPGLLRPFKKDKDFTRNLGEEVEIHLFQPQEGAKDYIGCLKSFDKDSVTILFEDEVEASFARSNIALIRKYIDFSDL
ncbi:MAG: ribosome maturation factor RimP [Lachnospiraceae bacterium]|nr:ribosome maturation factor RimP [Lachnospiraceae bacterium]